MLCDNLKGWGGKGSEGVFNREGTHVYLQSIHSDVQQKLSQYGNYPRIKNK